MKPEEFAEDLINSFLEIVGNMEMAKLCAEECTERIMKEADMLTLDWWKLVLKCVKQF